MFCLVLYLNMIAQAQARLHIIPCQNTLSFATRFATIGGGVHLEGLHSIKREKE